VRRWHLDPRATRRGRGPEKGGAGAEPADHALGRSRGGWGSKLHLACDGRGAITAFRLTAGQINECAEAVALLDPVRIGRRRRPRALLGDKAYSTRSIRAWARRHRVRLVVPERADQVAQRSHRPGRKPRFEREVYRARNVVERAVGWLKRWRRVATRAEKLAVTFRAAICLVLAARYATTYFSDTT
jgi:transposase